MPNFGFEVQGMDATLRFFRDAPDKLMDNARKAVAVTAYNVKKDAGDNIRAIPQRIGPKGGRLRPLSNAARFDTPTVGDDHSVETKVEFHGKQARIIGPIEHGTPFTAPKWPLKRAGEANRDDFIRGIERAIDDATQ